MAEDGMRPARSAEEERLARRQRWIGGAFLLAFWGGFTLFTIAGRTLDPRFGETGHVPAGEVFQIVLEYGVWALLTPAIFWLSRRFRLEGRYWGANLGLHLGVALCGGILLDAFGHYTFHALVDVPWKRPFSWKVSLLGFRFIDEMIVYLLVLAAGFARDYFVRFQERHREAAQLQAEAAELHAHTAELQAQLAESRLQALRMQLNPHFLFNTLNTISSYLERDPRGVRRMIARLSELLRYTLEKTDAREVPLRQELGFVEGYLEIQRIRFEDRLAVHHDIAPDVLDALVPNLILQPLVENAIKHGVSQREDGGRVELRAWREGDLLHLSVRDDGPGLPPAAGDGAAAAPQGIGLRNTRERLESLYGPAQRFDLEPAEGGGLVAHLILPYHTGTDLYTTAVAR